MLEIIGIKTWSVYVSIQVKTNVNNCYKLKKSDKAGSRLMNQIYRNRVTYSVGELCEVCIIHHPIKPLSANLLISRRVSQSKNKP